MPRDDHGAPNNPPEDQGDDLSKMFEETENEVSSTEASLASLALRSRTKAQNFIVYAVVGGFVLLLLLLALGILVKEWADWKDGAEFLLAMITSALLPVVTLVVGYYFGKESDSK